MIPSMSTVNKLSLREEVERLKNEFDQLAKEKKINSETKMLCQSMLMLINLLVSIFLEKTTKKTSKNSSTFGNTFFDRANIWDLASYVIMEKF